MVDRWSGPLLSCGLALLAAAAPLGAQAPPPKAAPIFDPSDVYFQGWLQVRDADKLEQQGDFVGALEKLERARELFDTVARYQPDWKPEMVAGRRASTVESIGRVRPQAMAQRKPEERALAELEGPLPADPRGDLARPEAVPQPADALARQAADLEQEVARLRAAGPEAAVRLRDAEAELARARANLAARPVQSEFDRLNRRVEELEREREATARALQQSRGAREAAERRIAAVEQDLAKARQEVADLERNLETERRVSNEVIRGQREQLRALQEVIRGKDHELAEARTRIVDLERTLDETREAFGELRDERDALLRERDHMAALLKLNEAGRIQELVEQNMALAKELRMANERFERVKADNDETKDKFVEAQRDLAIAKARIINLEKNNRAQQDRIAELEQRLRRADQELANNRGNPEETVILRDIIRRQLRIQERRRQARDLLLAQVRRLGIADPQLDQAIAMIDGDELQLTPAESRLINDRQVDGEFVSPFAVSADHRERSLDRVEQERLGLDRAGSKAFASGRLAASEELFQLILEAHPGHVPTLQKIGVVRLRRDDLAGSAEAIRDAVAMDTENAYVRRMLGVALYTLGEDEEAEAELRHAVAIDPADAKAHVYLGNVTFRLGRKSEAEEHFKAAIQADPTLNEPYFNLAFLCANNGRKEEGRDYYQIAIDNGAVPDLDLEQRLGL